MSKPDVPTEAVAALPPTRRTTSERSCFPLVLLPFPETRSPSFDFFGTRRRLGACVSCFGARGVGGESERDCEARGSPKPGAEPTADGVAETKRIVGMCVGSGVVCRGKVDSVRV